MVGCTPEILSAVRRCTVSVNKSFAEDSEKVQEVIDTYLGPDKPTMVQVAEVCSTGFGTVQFILSTHLDKELLQFEKSLRKSRAKAGPLNPMYGKKAEQHPNYKGAVKDGHGYLQIKRNGKYVFVHRIVMAEILGLSELPPEMEVHHIDEVKTNNDPDNLALVTPGGHRQLHAHRSTFEKLPLWHRHQLSISQ